MKYFGPRFEKFFLEVEKELKKHVDDDTDIFFVTEKVLSFFSVVLPNELIIETANVLDREREKLKIAKTQKGLF